MGFLAIIGIPPFAGFWSKDEIIAAAFSHSTLTGLVTLVGAGITAFYMTRMMAMTFFGTARWQDDVHPHESPKVMTIPVTLLVVAVGAMMGWVQYAKREVPVTAPSDVSIFTKAARADLYGDAFNETVFMRPGQYLTRSLVFVDNKIVDGVVNGTAGLVGVIASQLRKSQTGFARSYALLMVLGVVAIGLIAAIVGMA